MLGCVRVCWGGCRGVGRMHAASVARGCQPAAAPVLATHLALPCPPPPSKTCPIVSHITLHHHLPCTLLPLPPSPPACCCRCCCPPPPPPPPARCLPWATWRRLQRPGAATATCALSQVSAALPCLAPATARERLPHGAPPYPAAAPCPATPTTTPNRSTQTTQTPTVAPARHARTHAAACASHPPTDRPTHACTRLPVSPPTQA